MIIVLASRDLADFFAKSVENDGIENFNIFFTVHKLFNLTRKCCSPQFHGILGILRCTHHQDIDCSLNMHYVEKYVKIRIFLHTYEGNFW